MSINRWAASRAGVRHPDPCRGDAADQAPHDRLYAEHCGRSYEEVERALDRDRFMTAEEALEWGLIDRILKEREVGI